MLIAGVAADELINAGSTALVGSVDVLALDADVVVTDSSSADVASTEFCDVAVDSENDPSNNVLTLSDRRDDALAGDMLAPSVVDDTCCEVCADATNATIDFSADVRDVSAAVSGVAELLVGVDRSLIATASSTARVVPTAAVICDPSNEVLALVDPLAVATDPTTPGESNEVDESDEASTVDADVVINDPSKAVESLVEGSDVPEDVVIDDVSVFVAVSSAVCTVADAPIISPDSNVVPSLTDVLPLAVDALTMAPSNDILVSADVPDSPSIVVVDALIVAPSEEELVSVPADEAATLADSAAVSPAVAISLLAESLAILSVRSACSTDSLVSAVALLVALDSTIAATPLDDVVLLAPVGVAVVAGWIGVVVA